MSSLPTSRGPMGRWAGWALIALAAAGVLGAGSIVTAGETRAGPGPITGWTGADAAVGCIAAAAVVAAAALVAFVGGPDALARTVALAVVGLCAVAPVYVVWSAVPPTVAVIAAAIPALAVPALTRLAAVSADGNAGGQGRRDGFSRAVAAAWLVCAIAVVVTVAFRDPFLDPECRGPCATGSTLVVPVPELVAAARVAVGAVAVGCTVLAVGRLVRSRAASYAVLIGWAAVPALALLTWSMVDAAAPELWSGLDAADAALAAMALAILAIAHLTQATGVLRRRQAMERLADELTAELGDDALEARLRSALRDPAARVAFPTPTGGLVAMDGTPTPGDHGAAATALRRGAEVVAILLHAPDVRAEELASAMGPAALAAIANAGLRARIRAVLDERLRSRLRVVEAADEARRLLERDLHDGLQQDLLVLRYDLALAAGAGSREASTFGAEAADLLERTRAIAHGVFPAVVDDLGVEASLDRLAEDSPIVLETDVDVPARPPPAIERTIYLLARHAVGAADPFRPLSFTVRAGPESVTVHARPSRAAVVAPLEDRVSALGGSVEEWEDAWQVVLPCA